MTDKPHGPVSARLMRKFYGADRVAPATQTELDQLRSDMATLGRWYGDALDEIKRLRAVAQSVCDVADTWDVEDRGMVLVHDVLTMLLPLRPNEQVNSRPCRTEENSQ